MTKKSDSAPTSDPPSQVDRFLEDILVDFILQREEGKDPDLDALLARHPRHAEEIARLLSEDGVPPASVGRPTSMSRERRRGFGMQAIGPWRILFHVASSGGGDVYKARHDETGEEVALKVLRKVTTIDPRDLRRFQHEARMLAELEHPHVVPLREIREDQGMIWMALPWIDGISLQEAIEILTGDRRASVIDPAELSIAVRARIIARIGRTLEELRTHGVLHRDLKPSNVMLDETLKPVLIDFGIARHQDYTTLTGTMDAPLGTPRYLAPELLAARAGASDPRSEVYALAITLFELLTGQVAFPGKTRIDLFRQIQDGLARPPHRVDPRIP
ncbi:MAG: serine/threonine protein kinase, partial [Planctomycetes bacterium]|nr:serine/threonine protein kinase [Planctomycetota bacterium]